MKISKTITLLSGLALLSVSAFAGEARLKMDPSANLQALKAIADPAQMPDPIVVRDNKLFELDASVVLHNCDIQKLYEKAYDFNDYTKLQMPDLTQSIVVEGTAPADSTLFVWTEMQAFGKDSKGYMQVEITPQLEHPSSTRGITWQGIDGRPGRPGWTYEDAPAFRDFYGSWYLQEMGNRDVYARYFVAAEPATSIPGFILDHVVPARLKANARKTIQILWAAAQGRTTPLKSKR